MIDLAPAPLRLARHARLRQDLSAAQLDALVITSLPNVAYLTGLFASAASVVISADWFWLITDGRYLGTAQHVAADLPGVDLVIAPSSRPFDTNLVDALAMAGAVRVGFESTDLTVRRHTDLLAAVRAARPDCQLLPVEGLVERLRMVKDAWELAVLTEAGGRLSDVAKCIIPKALAGMRERDVAAVIEAELRRADFDKPAFDTIVASGSNSAVPHYRAGDRVLTVGDLVVMDFGGMFRGYAVDMTRTVTMGRATERQRRLLEGVAAAQSAAFDAIRAGVPATDIDRAARDAMARVGLAEAFGHGTGHGLGLEVHERPRVAPFRAELPGEPLQPGMVFTIEPGAYFPEWGGARIEDDAALTTEGALWLTDVPRLW